VAILYKGAGPGTHWDATDATKTGLYCPSTTAPSGAAALLHITAFSHPSAYVSLSASFAVAREYALAGPAGLASQSRPGHVYVVDTSIAPRGIHLFDPLREIVNTSRLTAASAACLPWHHDGAADLILGVASKAHSTILAKVPHRFGPAPGSHPPNVTQHLRALVFALRDAEVLVDKIPANCIVRREPVW